MQRPIGPVAIGAMKTSIILIILAAVLLAAVPAIGDDEMLQPGQTFPPFELPAHDGTTVSDADLLGSPYLLFFYPKANTGG